MKLINISSESTKTHKLRSLSGNVLCFWIELNTHRKPKKKNLQKHSLMCVSQPWNKQKYRIYYRNPHLIATEFLFSTEIIFFPNVRNISIEKREAPSMFPHNWSNCIWKKNLPFYPYSEHVNILYTRYWCKFINYMEANSYYVFKINSSHYFVLLFCEDFFSNGFSPCFFNA